jgi:hypothetical protein
VACGESCTDTCSSACGGNCTACTGCSDTCSASCSENCSGGCDGTCSDACTSCTGCSGTCTGTCTGCTGCTSCTGTCTGDCNNACTSANAATTIANLGSNITQGVYILGTDYSSLKSAIENEITRRSLGATANPLSAYLAQLDAADPTLRAHADKIFTDIKVVDTGSTYGVNANNTVLAADFTGAIAYIKTLMNENIKA